MDIAFLLPDELNLTVFITLLGVSFIASMLTAAISMGGGILMLSVFSTIFPPTILLPVFAAIQFGSNAGRALVQRRHIQWSIVVYLSLGGVFGAALGVKFVAILPEQLFKIIIGIFILVMVWTPQLKIQGRGPRANFTAGTILSFLGMIVGVTGPLVMTFIRYLPDRRQVVATHASVMTVFTISRVIAFMAIGFSLWQYLPFVLAMIFTGFLGTLVGSQLLDHLPEQTFRLVLKFVISALAIYLLYRAF